MKRSSTGYAHAGAAIDELEYELIVKSLDASRIGLCVIAADERVVLMTHVFAAKLGFDAVEVLGRSARSMLSARLAIPDFDELIRQDAGELSVELPLVRGERVSVVLLQARSVRAGGQGGATGQPYRVLSAIEVADFGVTSTRIGELRRRLEAINSAIVVCDCIHPDMPIVFVNNRFKAMTGYSADEAIGRNCRFLQGNDRDQAPLPALRESLKAGRSSYAVLRNYRRDGTLFLNEVLISPVRNAAGLTTHWVGLLRELPQRH